MVDAYSDSRGTARSPRRIAAAAFIGTMLFDLSCCSPPPATQCTAGSGRPMLVFNLFFGRTMPGGRDVTDQIWREFRDDVVSVDLPDGYTVVDADGAWMNPRRHRTIHEATRLLIVALPDSEAGIEAVDRVKAQYEARFQQQSVGMTVTRSCGKF